MSKDNKKKDKEKDKKEKEIMHHLHLRIVTMNDYNDIKEIMDRVYSNAGGSWTRKELKSMVKYFPQGQICIEDNGKVVAAAFSLIVDYSKFGDSHTYKEITGDGLLTTHDEDGDTLYGIDVFVHPDYQGMRLGRRLYDARKELCERLNLRAIIAGGRIPGYQDYAEKLTPRQYIEKVKNKEVYDPILTFQIANNFHVRKVMTNYLPDDTESKSYATLLEWINIDYDEGKKLIGGEKHSARVGVVQWMMRPVTSVEDLLKHIEFFVDTVADYKADFIIFPEFFNAPLMSAFNSESSADAVRQLAEYTEEIKEAMVKFALSYNINIIGGSMPLYQKGKLYNVSYLCRRDGTWDMQYKLHVTPDEQIYWGLQGGNKLNVFETDSGKIGILICYDIEFTELSRILSEEEINILFVPFWTDTKTAFLRVSRCAQARAIENECYVAISGSVGNLPGVENMDIQYAQSAVFSPSDFSFPHDAIVAEATPNTETMLVVDLDYYLLKKLRMQGTVRNSLNKRSDLYKIEWLKK
jgi:predicted amidohydrolase/ribosomal protein S18 acetylase RimI-like enzyme